MLFKIKLLGIDEATKAIVCAISAAAERIAGAIEKTAEPAPRAKRGVMFRHFTSENTRLCDVVSTYVRLYGGNKADIKKKIVKNYKTSLYSHNEHICIPCTIANRIIKDAKSEK